MSPGSVRRLPLLLLCTVLAAAVLGAGFAAGWLARGRSEPRAALPMHMIRERDSGQWHFINPLLECDESDDHIQRPELMSFKNRLLQLIETSRGAGEIASASVYFRELNDGPWIGVYEHVGYLPASLLKLPMLITILKRAERDPGFLAQRLTFAGRRDDNTLIAFRPPETLVPGRSYTVEELSRRMMRFSDNNAAGLLGTLVAMPELNETLRGLGVLPGLVATQGRLEIKAVSAFLRVLYNASYLSREHSELALEMLSQSFFREGIIAGVPGGVTVVSKYGEATVGANTLQLHEFAIVYHERRPYLLGVMTQGQGMPALARFIREVSRLIYEEVDAQSRHQAGADPPGSPGQR